MIKSKKLILSLFVAVVGSGFFFGIAGAQSQTITVDHIARIRSNCLTAKNTIAQLDASDALLRVNRGQLYESLASRLMINFNSRVENNGYNAKSLIAVTEFYSQVLEGFRDSYQGYSEQLSATLKIDCIKEPVKFYNSALEARDKRKQVNAYIVRLAQNISEYRSAFDAFVINFNNKSGRDN